MNFIAASLLTISCSYSFMQAPFAAVAFTVYDDGRLDSSAQITSTGAPMHKETLTAVAKAEGEMIHAWISQDTENSLELIVYDKPQADGRSKMVNPHIPFGNVMWGECTGLP